MSSATRSFPRISLGAFPTPIQECVRLSRHLGGPRILVKRDDLTGPAGGGNKIRKLEFVLAEASAAGADCLVTIGVGQSNSVRQIAGVGASLGLDVHVAQITDRVANAADGYTHGGNALLTTLFGAQTHPCSSSDDRIEVLERIAANLRAAGRRPFTIPYGVSSPTGALGYIVAAEEIAEQAGDLETDAIVHASGTGGTQAGLLIGTALCMPGTSVVGVDVDADPARVRADIASLTRELAGLLDNRVTAADPELHEGCAGAEYGSAPTGVLEAIRLFAQTEGLLLDPVYSGVGAAGLIEMVQQGRWGRNDTVVFVHTGGGPGLHAYRSRLTDFLDATK